MTADLPTHPSTEAVGEVRREQLAAIEHERWADWQRWMHAQCSQYELDSAALVIPPALVQRWERQIRTKYEDLSEEEKRSDREQVDRYWPLLVAEFEKLRSDLSAMTSDRDWLRTEFEKATAEAARLRLERDEAREDIRALHAVESDLRGERDAAIRNWTDVQDRWEALLPVVKAAKTWREKHFDHDPGDPDGPELYLAAAVDALPKED